MISQSTKSQSTTDIEEGATDQTWTEAGKMIADPPSGEEVVITGMAGHFPESDNIADYRDHLLSKKNLISHDNRRWEHVNDEIPHGTGKVIDIEKFDAGFFGLHYRQAQSLDPMCRQLLERSFEAMIDAGVNPSELRGSNTGVYIGATLSDTEPTWFYHKLEPNSFAFTGCQRSMIANRISYFFGFKGPSHVIDTACSTSVSALEHAYRAIRMGRCDKALVGAVTLCLHPTISLQFAKLGTLSKNSICRSFDNDANGYVRSEASVVIFLQKAKDAKRVYAQIVHAKINCDGFKEEGITFPSTTAQKKLLTEAYKECHVPPETVDFVEAHGTGTEANDVQEVATIDEVFCTNRKIPLPVGSVKSNVGHTETASGLSSLVKVLLCMEMNCILPNINYSTPKKGVEALEKGRVVVVTDTIPWPKNGSGIAGINNFGFGGTNGHVILKRNCKQKANAGLPEDDIPRLVCVSGRTEHAVNYMLRDISQRKLDVEFVRLFHEVFGSNISGHPVRGYILQSKTAEICSSVKRFTETKRPLCLVFCGSKYNWFNIACQLVSVPLFRTSIQKIHNVLAPKGINIADVITNKNELTNGIVNVIVGNVAIQIGLLELLKAVGIECDHLIGYSTGELVAAYADGSLTLEQTVRAALVIGQCYRDLKKVSTKTYEVKLDKTQILEVFENQLEVIGHNSEDNYIISGPAQNAVKCIHRLRTKGVAVKEIKNNSGLHSKYSSQIRSVLLNQLNHLIKIPKQRSSKWITSSVNKDQHNSDLAKYASAEYFVHCLLKPVLFYEATLSLPRDTVLLEVGEQLTNTVSDHNTITLLSSKKNTVNDFLTNLGKMYEMGYDLKLEKLYPDVEWPVSVGTPMLSPLIKWNYDADWFVALHKEKDKGKPISGDRLLRFCIKSPDMSFMLGHVVDGRNLIPATYYLVAVWETFSKIMGTPLNDTRVTFENVRFLRATNIPKSEQITFNISIQKQTGLFEITELGSSIVTGYIHSCETLSQDTVALPLPMDNTDGVRYLTEDVYRELKLRGYNYKGAFRGIKECNLSGTKALVEWTGNWVAFIDNMLQVILLQEDFRILYVPIGIDRLTINPKEHIDCAEKLGEYPSLPVYVYKDLDMVRSGGIEAMGFHVKTISRKLNREPLLESYHFIPFQTKLSLDDAVRINIQIVLENNNSMRYRAVEVIDEANQPDSPPLSQIIHEALEDHPLINSDVVLLSRQLKKLERVIVEDSFLEQESDTCSLVTGANILGRPEFARTVENALKYNGFAISREAPDLHVEDGQKCLENLIVIAVQETETEKLVLLRKSIKFHPTLILNLTNCHEQFDWLRAFQSLTAYDRVLVFAHGDQLHGILGLYYCIKSEITSLKAKCFFISDTDAPTFDISDEFYAKQLQKGLSMNVFKDGEWGTYRYLRLETDTTVQCEHIVNNIAVRGDLSSFRWIQGPLRSNATLLSEQKLIYIYYSSLNFRDVMTALGRVSNGVIMQNYRKQVRVEGLEFAGRDSTGRRVMGMGISGALSSMVVVDSRSVWEIPDEWTMEEGATVPIAYNTVIYSFITVARIKAGESILIHWGTGGVGQAAIYVALHYKCNIFTTVGSQEKKEWIRQKFPKIPENQIGNSRDTSFEQMVMRKTQGRGVDVVLNSLSDEKLLASIRCLAPNGRFLEIGKYDMVNNSAMSMKSFRNGRSFHGISLDLLYNSAEFREYCHNILSDGLKAGYVRPLNRTVFEKDEVEKAFRFMASGKHTGKILIKLRDEELERNSLPDMRLFKGSPRFYCNPGSCYIICGGLGGFGLELADWLVSRGADKLVLTSRQGLKTGYQASRMRIWKNYSVTVLLSTSDITTKVGCTELINEAHKLGPIEAIFNLAVVLRDALLENQTEENFNAVLAPKVDATRHLDLLSRAMCPDLKHFVMFSSAICRLGNAGQTPYGLANSIIERMCEQRKRDGYPAQAIQWGAIGEVGILVDTLKRENDSEICGMLFQTISSCLEQMDTFLSRNETVVSSIVVAEKKGKATGTSDMVEAVRNIVGIADLKKISLHATLSELGMDSIMSLEIRQTLEREYEQFMTPADIRSMTFARLLEISHANEDEGEEENGKDQVRATTADLFFDTSNKDHSGFEMLVRLPSLVEEKASAPVVFLLPCFERFCHTLEPLAGNLRSHPFCLQYPFKDNTEPSVEALAELMLPFIHDNLPIATPFTIIGYSHGCTVGLHLASLLEEKGRPGHLILIDGSPAMSKDLLLENIPNTQDERYLQTYLLCTWLKCHVPSAPVSEYRSELLKCGNFEERIDLAMAYLPKIPRLSGQFNKQTCRASCARLQSILNYRPSFPKLKSAVNLYKPTNLIMRNYDVHYKLQELCENPVSVDVFDGDHVTILENPKVADSINNTLQTVKF